MRDGLRGALSPQATPRQMDVLAAFVAAGGSVVVAARIVGIQPSTVKRHLAATLPAAIVVFYVSSVAGPTTRG